MTLKEIAKLAGVSAATVSYVLNNSAAVSEDTRNRVLKIVEETGYTSNVIARSLRVKKTRTIGIVVEDITVPHTAAIIDGINEYAERHAYNTVLSNLRLMSKIESRFESIVDYKQDITSALNVLLGMRVDGIIYVSIHDRSLDGIVRPVALPFVYCYCYTGNPSDICVTYDNFNISYDLTSYFINQGHTRIGLIAGKMDSFPSHQRMMGYQQALMDHSIPMNLEHIRSGDWQYEAAKKAGLEMLMRDNPPTAIYAMNDIMALGVYHAAEAGGIRIPRDLSVIGFDNAECIHYARPALTTVSLPLHEMGECSIRMLLSRIQGGPLENTKLTLPCQIVHGNSVAARAD